MTFASARADLRLIAELVAPGERVLDVGCGDGALLRALEEEKGIDGRGIEIRHGRVEMCVREGLSVIQGDADTDLHDFPDRSFDCVILSEVLQNTHRPRRVLDELLRIGARAIVSFPNFGHWRARLRLLLCGRMPTGAEGGGVPWYDTPNIHLCTIRDFLQTSRELGIQMVEGYALDRRGRPRRLRDAGGLGDLLVEQAVFVLSRGSSG